jgi:hypothetical protein
MNIIKKENRELTKAITRERHKLSALLEDFNWMLGLFRNKTRVYRVLTAILLTTVILTACDPGKSPEIYEQATETLLPNSTPAETQTPTSPPTPTETTIPTETATPRPTVTPIVEGNLAPFLGKENRDASIVKDILIIQNVINSYDPESDLGFGEYISGIKRSFENNEETDHIYRLLDNLGQYDKINTLILARVMQENLPELGIIDTGVWSENRVADIFPPEGISDIVYQRETELEPGYMVGFYLYEGFEITGEHPKGSVTIGDIPVRIVPLGALIFNSENYDPLDPASDFTLFITVARLKGPTGIEGLNAIALLVATIDEEGRMVLIEVNEGNIDEHFGSGVIIQMGGKEWVEFLIDSDS